MYFHLFQIFVCGVLVVRVKCTDALEQSAFAFNRWIIIRLRYISLIVMLLMFFMCLTISRLSSDKVAYEGDYENDSANNTESIVE